MKAVGRSRMHVALLLSCLLPLTVAVADDGQTQRLIEAVLELKADIEDETSRLQELRERVEAERLPLADRLDALREDVRGLRRDAQRVRGLRTEGERERERMTADADVLAENTRFVQTVFSEYRRSLEMRAGVADGVWLAPRLRALDSRADDADAEGALPESVAAILELSETWNRSRLGGAAFEGTVLDSRGVECAGRFAVFGPLAYFSTADGARAGLAVSLLGDARPSLYEETDEAERARILDVVSGREAVVAVDVTGGDALKVERARRGTLEHLRKGGIVMVPLLLVGLLSVILAAWKALDLHLLVVRPGEAVRRTMALALAGELDAAREGMLGVREPLASLVYQAIAHRHLSREHLEEIIHERVLGHVPRIERHLGTLAVFGGIAPLLGLLGTVTGMIHTFQLVTVFGSGDARLLSGGISEALVTTEVGLAIAIPVLVVHAFLTRRARCAVAELEQTALGLVNDLKVRGERP